MQASFAWGVTITGGKDPHQVALQAVDKGRQRRFQAREASFVKCEASKSEHEIGFTLHKRILHILRAASIVAAACQRSQEKRS